MRNVKQEIGHLEKKIRILEMIERLNNRILSNIKDEKIANENSFFGIKKHLKQRIEIDQKMKERLINYYLKTNGK